MGPKSALTAVLLTVAVLNPVDPGAARGQTAAEERRVDPREGGFEVGLGEWAVTLESGSVRPGEITFAIHNGGAKAHGFRIRSTSHRRGRDRFEARSRLLAPGEDAELTVSLRNGVYDLDCYVEEAGVGEHDELGMEARLDVRPDAPWLTPEPEASPAEISMERFAFSPAELTVEVGTTVVWTNKDPADHTVTAADGSFDSDVLAPGADYRRLFDAPGTFSYQCDLHPGMTGQVKVVE